MLRTKRAPIIGLCNMFTSANVYSAVERGGTDDLSNNMPFKMPRHIVWRDKSDHDCDDSIKSGDFALYLVRQPRIKEGSFVDYLLLDINFNHLRDQSVSSGFKSQIGERRIHYSNDFGELIDENDIYVKPAITDDDLMEFAIICQKCRRVMRLGITGTPKQARERRDEINEDMFAFLNIQKTTLKTEQKGKESE